MLSLPRRVLPALYVLVIIVSIGVIGYMVIERWSFIDALYMTILTITTVGYLREPKMASTLTSI